MSRTLEVLELFAEAHHLVDRHEAHSPHAGGLALVRRAWRLRQAERGECRSCRRPALAGRRYCDVHRRKSIERAMRSQGRAA